MSGAHVLDLDAGAGGALGAWADDDGLPCFDLDVTRARAAGDVWHQVGNRAVTATTHADGRTVLWATRRGLVRVAGERARWGTAGLRTTGARWGAGYARWTAAGGGVQATREVRAPWGDDALLRVEVEVRCRRPVTWREQWDVRPFPLLAGALMSPMTEPPASYGSTERRAWHALFAAAAASRAATDVARRVLARRMRVRPGWVPAWRALVYRPSRRLRPFARPALFDPALPLVVVAVLDDLDVIGGSRGVFVRLPAGSHRFRLLVGLADDESEVPSLLRAGRADPAPVPVSQVEAPTPGLAREARWHVAQLVTAAVPDDYFGHRYVPQGSAYSFVHGVQGAPRDYAFTVAALAPFDAAAARELLEVMLRMTAPSGAMYYAHTGRGQVVSGWHRAPTDLPLFLLWAIAEYLEATGERSLLDERVPFWPEHRGAASTVRERVLLAGSYLRGGVGVGPHGLLRVGSGDWNDPISAMVPDRRAFHARGESMFNTAMGAYVLPLAAALVGDAHPDAAVDLQAFGAGLRAAAGRAWTGRWFLRGYDGTGGPVGDDHLFLDAQVWALIAPLGTDEHRAVLVHEIATRCLDPSPIGATILDRPHPVRSGMLAPGTDTNGGVWAAMNALLAWGLAHHDLDLAWRCVAQQSLAAHARAYPNVWYGIWSGPDSYNAHFADRPGETFVQPATPMTEFPVMNSNAHAGPLLALRKVSAVRP